MLTWCWNKALHVMHNEGNVNGQVWVGNLTLKTTTKNFILMWAAIWVSKDNYRCDNTYYLCLSISSVTAVVLVLLSRSWVASKCASNVWWSKDADIHEKTYGTSTRTGLGISITVRLRLSKIWIKTVWGLWLYIKSTWFTLKSGNSEINS